MSTIIIFALVAWTATCLVVIHHSRMRAAARSLLCRAIRSLRRAKALKD